jgi:hypothetical protein
MRFSMTAHLLADMGNLFFSTKDKQVAVDMLALFESLAPKEYIATQYAENEQHNEL